MSVTREQIQGQKSRLKRGNVKKKFSKIWSSNKKLIRVTQRSAGEFPKEYIYVGRQKYATTLSQNSTQGLARIGANNYPDVTNSS